MEMLDRLYAKFDNLARQHRLFKVKLCLSVSIEQQLAF